MQTSAIENSETESIPSNQCAEISIIENSQNKYIPFNVQKHQQQKTVKQNIFHSINEQKNQQSGNRDQSTRIYYLQSMCKSLNKKILHSINLEKDKNRKYSTQTIYWDQKEGKILRNIRTNDKNEIIRMVSNAQS